MNRHSFRWRGPVVGLFYLAVAGSWAVWKQDLLTRQQFSYTLSGVLIVLGALGVVATFWHPRSRSSTHDMFDTTHPLKENHEDPDPQP